MAVIKHIASKNADYGESERYLIFQHNEYTQKPVLDENGHMILRDEYYLDGLNCDPFTFASECQELNSYYHKIRISTRSSLITTLSVLTRKTGMNVD